MNPARSDVAPVACSAFDPAPRAALALTKQLPDPQLLAQVTALTKLCRGEAAYLPALDLIGLANARWRWVSKQEEPEELLMAVMVLDRFCDHVGVRHRVHGDRAAGLATELRRYLLPYLLEEGLTAKPMLAERFRMQEYKEVCAILAGAQLLPAATVAGDLLKRPGVTCVWLTVAEAEQVSTATAAQLTTASVSGELPRATRVADGSWLIPAVDLRQVEVLRERSKPHGLSAAAANNTLGALRSCISHARGFGVDLRIKFEDEAQRAVPPLAAEAKQQAPTSGKPYLSLPACRQIAEQLHPTHQLVFWLQRLVGLRISEAYGPRIIDFRDGPTPSLRISRQGGTAMLVRDPQTGKLVSAGNKKRTKTELSKRTLPLPLPVAELIRSIIATHHVDLDPSAEVAPFTVDKFARLVPGVQQDNTAGAAGYRHALKRALVTVGIIVPAQEDPDEGEEQDQERTLAADPHDLRASLITDLRRLGADPHLRRFYCGHEDSGVVKDVHTGYDRGPQAAEELREIATVIEVLCAAPGGPGRDLRVPTDQVENWGQHSRRGQQKHLIAALLNDTGWRVGRAGGAATLTVISQEPTALSTETGLSAPGADRQQLVPTEPGPRAGDAQSEPTVWLTAAQAAVRYGVREATVRRQMAHGMIATRHLMRGKQQVMVATLTDLDSALNSAGQTPDQLAAQVGWTRHQVWTLLRSSGQLDHHQAGRPITLTREQQQVVLEEVACRRARADVAVTVKEAGARLGLEILTVETLLRRGTLVQADEHDGTRRRYVELASIQAYLLAYPVGPAASAEDPVLSRAQVATLLGEDRRGMAHLVTSRQLTACVRERKQLITRDSLLILAASRGMLDEVLSQIAAP